MGEMLTVTIDRSEGISGADIPEQAVKKNAYRLRLPVSPQPPRVFRISFYTERLFTTSSEPGTGYM